MHDTAHMTPNAPTPDQLGRRIREARKAAGLSQSALARNLDVADRTVLRWEQRASAVMSVTQIKAVADALGVSFSDLVAECGGAAA